jgi:hypothetical protein
MAQNDSPVDSSAKPPKRKHQGTESSDISDILSNPLMLQKLGDRVYRMYVDDLHKHHERSRDYGGSF